MSVKRVTLLMFPAPTKTKIHPSSRRRSWQTSECEGQGAFAVTSIQARDMRLGLASVIRWIRPSRQAVNGLNHGSRDERELDL